jgi:hypothetical protein
MTDTSQRQGTGDREGAGWLTFAATMLILAGVFKILDALYAFKYDDALSEELQTIVFARDPVAWGWTWLVVGIVLIAAGIAVLRGAEWARWVGVVAAAVAAVVSSLLIFVQPFWALVGILLSILVIQSLATYGGKWARSIGRA